MVRCVLCAGCRRLVPDDGATCPTCGTPARAGAPVLDLVLDDGRRLGLTRDVTIGRADDNAVRLDDPAVSRHHARIRAGAGGPVVEDVGSSHGTWLDGRRLDGRRRPLRDGSRIRLGDQELRVERRRRSADAGRTVVVPAGASRAVAAAPGDAVRPRLRSGYALKRLEAAEGDDRWVLRDLRSGKFLRLSDADAALLELLDGERTVADLLAAAQERDRATGAARLARLLTELRDRGLLAGDGAEPASGAPEAGRLRRALTPHKATWDGAGALFERLYQRGGWVLFTGPARVAEAVVAVLGIGVFAALVAGRYGTPFVVASKVGLGGLVFLLGRFALVAAHEGAHGLALAAVGRRVGAVGLKLVLVFPYAYVDTSEAWFEPRRRRILVSAAGPASDLVLAALFSLACLALTAGTVRDIFFQLALAAYIGALFNLNPFIDRDGYQILADLLGVPGLRRRAREQLARRLRGGARTDDARVLTRYALCGLAWSVVAAGFAAAMSLRYVAALEQLLPAPVVWGMLAALWLGLLTPVLVTLAAPVVARLRHRGETAPAAAGP
jgi:putative peptide zinc metalloprotease protein